MNGVKAETRWREPTRLPDAPAGSDVWRACAGGWAECLQEGRSARGCLLPAQQSPHGAGDLLTGQGYSCKMHVPRAVCDPLKRQGTPDPIASSTWTQCVVLSPSTSRDFWKGEHTHSSLASEGSLPTPGCDVRTECAHELLSPGARRPRGIVVMFACVDACAWVRSPVRRGRFEGGSRGSCFDTPSLRPTRERAVAGLGHALE